MELVVGYDRPSAAVLIAENTIFERAVERSVRSLLSSFALRFCREEVLYTNCELAVNSGFATIWRR